MKNNNIETALSCFEGGFNCCQAIFSTYGPQLGLSKELALKIASPFGSGMGRMGNTCGVVTGAFMVLGLKNGRISIDDEIGKERSYQDAKDFAESFEKIHKSIMCKELIGYDISTPEGLTSAKEKGRFNEICPKLVKTSAEILEKLLLL